jgi:hypothetical protein
MDLQTILNQVEQERTGSVKTASAPAPQVTNTQPATQNNAVDDLLKIAAELSGAEKQAELAHASMMGQAMADAIITRFGSYEGEMAKVASAAGGYSESDVEEATRIGYNAGIEAGIQKAAEYLDSLEQGHAPANSDMQKQAEYEEYLQSGAEKLAAASEALSPEDLVKFAQQENLMPVLEKLAEEYESGYKEAEDKIASELQEEFLKGAAETEIMIELLKQSAVVNGIDEGNDPLPANSPLATVNMDQAPQIRGGNATIKAQPDTRMAGNPAPRPLIREGLNQLFDPNRQ